MVKKAKVFATDGTRPVLVLRAQWVGVCDRGRVARLSLELEYGIAGSLFMMGKRGAMGKRVEEVDRSITNVFVESERDGQKQGRLTTTTTRSGTRSGLKWQHGRGSACSLTTAGSLKPDLIGRHSTRQTLFAGGG
jgi:hypothetical protein